MHLYNDLAMVVYDLYENKDDIYPYELFLVSISGDEVSVLARSDDTHICISDAIHSQSYWEWVDQSKDIVNEIKLSGFHFEPHVTLCKKSGFNELQKDSFFSNLITIKNMNYSSSWSIGNVYAVLYKHDLFDASTHPEQIDFACYRISGEWRAYFDLGLHSMHPPRINKINIIKEILHRLSTINQSYISEMSLLFQIVTRISSLSYEKSRSKGNISVIDNIEIETLLNFHKEDTSKRLSFSIKHAKQLRKLLETAKDDRSLLIHNKRVYGIGLTERVNPKYTFCVSGHMEWHVDANGKKLLRYKHGEFYLPENDEIKNWRIDSSINNGAAREIAHSIRKDSDAFKNGAIIIITSNAKDEVRRLCSLRRGLWAEQKQIITSLEKTKTLFDIDGAVFVDESGNCHGIGIILDGEAVVGGSPARGARYNSAKTYIARCYKEDINACALILSSDEYFDIITTDDDEFKSLDKSMPPRLRWWHKLRSKDHGTLPRMSKERRKPNATKYS